MRYDDWYGLQLNLDLALAMDGAVTMRAVRAAYATKPDRLLIDAASEHGGFEVDRIVDEMNLAAFREESMQHFKRMFGATA